MIGLVPTGAAAVWGVLAGVAVAGFLPAGVAAAGIAGPADVAVGVAVVGGAAGPVAGADCYFLPGWAGGAVDTSARRFPRLSASDPPWQPARHALGSVAALAAAPVAGPVAEPVVAPGGGAIAVVGRVSARYLNQIEGQLKPEWPGEATPVWGRLLLGSIQAPWPEATQGLWR